MILRGIREERNKRYINWSDFSMKYYIIGLLELTRKDIEWFIFTCLVTRKSGGKKWKILGKDK